MNFLQAVIAFILILGPLVFIHEFGHFIVAKYLRIGVPVFSLGFGPRLIGFKRAETDYRLSLIPLGGFVRLAGDEADENRTGSPEEFLSRPKYQRFFVFVAGAAFNILLAVVAMWIYFGVYGLEVVEERYPVVIAMVEDSPASRSGIQRGDTLIEIAGRDVKATTDFMDAYNVEVTLSPNTKKPLLLSRDGELIELELQTGADPKQGHGDPGWALSWSATPTIGQVLDDSPAQGAGLQEGDRILGAAGKKPISEIELRELLESSPQRELELEIDRAGQIVKLPIVPRDENGKGRIGVGFTPAQTINVPLSLTEALVESASWNLYLSRTLFLVIKRLFTRELPLSTLSGPIGIAQVAREAFISGIDDILRMLAFLSLQLGILNLLPIPVLDGGHILIIGVESVMRRDLSERLKERVMQVGFVFLLGLMGAIIVLDVIKSM